jgi:glycine/D-amino acid oxidase-like deaminating enzyme
VESATQIENKNAGFDYISYDGTANRLFLGHRKEGLQVFDRSPVEHIEHRKKDVQLRTESGLIIKAKKIVYATGYEVIDYIDKKIVKLHTTYATISQHADKTSPLWKDNVMIWNTAQPYLYLRTTRDNRLRS